MWFPPIPSINSWQYLIAIHFVCTVPSAAGIVTTGGEHYFSVNSTEEREEWIETLRQSSVCTVYVGHVQ